MKGLLLKDYYTLSNQLKFFLIIIFVFSIIPGMSAGAFAIVYAAMLPITAVAFDERSKWDTLAATMPYTPACIVMGKYIVGYICIVAASLFSCISQSIMTAMGKIDDTDSVFILTIFVLIASVLIESVTLPLVFRFGVEKGRLALFLVIGVVVGAGFVLSDRIKETILGLNANIYMLAAVFIALTAAIHIVSVFLSIYVYKKRMRT